MGFKETSGIGFANWTLEFPRCTQRNMRGQCIHNHRHHGCCKDETGYRWWPENPLEPLPIAERARQHGIRWEASELLPDWSERPRLPERILNWPPPPEGTTCPECDQFLIMHHAAQACFPQT